MNGRWPRAPSGHPQDYPLRAKDACLLVPLSGEHSLEREKSCTGKICVLTGREPHSSLRGYHPDFYVHVRYGITVLLNLCSACTLHTVGAVQPNDRNGKYWIFRHRGREC